MKENKFGLIDIAKLIFSIFIIGIHTSVLGNTTLGFYMHDFLFRLAVPFFFLASGYFLARNALKGNRNEEIRKYIKKTYKIFIILGFIYLIISYIRFDNFSMDAILQSFWNLLILQSTSPIWFVGTLVASAIILLHLDDNKNLKKALLIALVLYILGFSFSTYKYIALKLHLTSIVNFLSNKFITQRNVFFIGFLFFGIGYYIGKNEEKFLSISKKWLAGLLFGGGILLLIENIFVHRVLIFTPLHEYYFSHLIVIPVLFLILSNPKLNSKIKFNTTNLRKLSTYIFYIHFLVIILLTKSKFMINSTITSFILTTLITIILSLILLLITKRKDKEIETKNIISFILYSAFVFMVIVTITKLFNKTVWADEVCSLSMLKHSYLDIIKLQINDVHPPLYYLMFKAFYEIVTIFVKINPIILGKIFSIIPLFILTIFALTKIRKNFGNVTCSLFLLFIIGMPNMINYYLEIRMYSWAMCFVTVAFIYLYDILKLKNNKSWILFVIFSILAAYTHLYACLAVGLMYLFLFIYFIINKDMKSLKKWFIYGILTIILYIPWALPLLNQIGIVKDGFWISEITFKTCLDYIRFVFFTELGDRFSKNFFSISLIILVLYLLIKNIKEKNIDEKVYSYMGIMVLTLTVGIGIIVSIIKVPVFISRYMFPALGCFWLVVSIMLAKYIKADWKKALILFIPLLITTNYFRNFAMHEVQLETELNKFNESIKILKEDNIILTNYNHIQLLFAYFEPNKTFYLYGGDDNQMIHDLFGNLKGNISINDIKNYLRKGKKVYFADNKYNTTRFQNEIVNNNLNYNLVDNFKMDYYNIDLYEITSEEKESEEIEYNIEMV